MNNFPGMPSILDTLVRDATQYFILIFSFHFLATLFLFVTPVGGTYHDPESSCSSCRVRSGEYSALSWDVRHAFP
jgi:hypothetical protein